MEDSKNTCSGTPNPPRGACVDSKALDAMPAVELAEELERVWGEMDEDSYDESVISAYLDALDRKVPLPDHPDAQTAYRRFSELTGKQVRKSGRGASSGILRAAIAAVVTLAVVFGAMITAQAAGLDVFGRIARWTKETFSFGENNVLDTDDELKGNNTRTGDNMANHENNGLSEFQEALNAYGITSVREPSWLPEGYALADVSVMDLGDFNLLSIGGQYKGPHGLIVINISRNSDAIPTQVQNGNEDVNSYFFGNTEIYLIENEENITLAWLVDDFECRVSGEKTEQLKLIAETMIV